VNCRLHSQFRHCIFFMPNRKSLLSGLSWVAGRAQGAGKPDCVEGDVYTGANEQHSGCVEGWPDSVFVPGHFQRHEEWPDSVFVPGPFQRHEEWPDSIFVPGHFQRHKEWPDSVFVPGHFQRHEEWPDSIFESRARCIVKGRSMAAMAEVTRASTSRTSTTALGPSGGPTAAHTRAIGRTASSTASVVPRLR